ncbi:MAG: hypothetical protein Ct9H300mP28_20410 [Pseudomonadota bacterium]|nr:MAG: hypothetical protein Ct9H300mP28_20410 [Pseudomonadota bacterium]
MLSNHPTPRGQPKGEMERYSMVVAWDPDYDTVVILL